MRAGDLNRRVTIRRSVTVDDGRGGQTVTSWPDVDTVWASIEPLSSREFLQAGALQNAMTHIVRIRYRDDVTIKHRLYWALRGTTFEILSMRETSQQEAGLELECVEVDV
jgi:SPP1 family predicted phage head-tail adaptor